jgi:hypothetical protein
MFALQILGILFIIFILAAIIAGAIKLVITVYLQEDEIKYMKKDINFLHKKLFILEDKKPPSSFT